MDTIDLYTGAIYYDVVNNLIVYLHDRMNGIDNDRSDQCATAIMKAMCQVVREWLNNPKRKGNYHCHLVYYAVRALLEHGFRQHCTVEEVYTMEYDHPEDLFIRCHADVDWRDPASQMLPYYKIKSVANKIGDDCVNVLKKYSLWQGGCPIITGLPKDI